MSGLRIWAHRGSSRAAPENTLASIQAAYEEGARHLEVDVDMLGDGTLVLLHDDTLDRTTSRTGSPKDLTARDLPLDAGSWFSPEFAGEPLPTLASAIELLNELKDMRVNFELKRQRSGKENHQLVASFQRELGNLTTHTPLVSSFDPRLLAAFDRAARPPVAVLVEGFFSLSIPLCRFLQATYLHPPEAAVTEKRLARWKAAGLTVNVWTVNDLARAEELEQMGVDGIFTDVPSLFIRG